jgi:hypothetical protein
MRSADDPDISNVELAMATNNATKSFFMSSYSPQEKMAIVFFTKVL